VRRHLVVHVAVAEHGVEVLHTLQVFPVIAVLQPLLDGAQVHGTADDRIIVLQEGRATQQHQAPAGGITDRTVSQL